MGYFNRQDEPGVRTPITTGEPPTTTQTCLVKHTARGSVRVNFDTEPCPPEPTDPNIISPPQEVPRCFIRDVEFNFLIDSECICWPPPNTISLNGWFDNAGSESFVIESGNCDSDRVMEFRGFNLVTYDVLRMCSESCAGTEQTRYTRTVPYLELLSEVDTNTGQHLGFPWKAGPFSPKQQNSTPLVDNETKGPLDMDMPPGFYDKPDGLIDGTDCDCLFPHTFQYTDPSTGKTTRYTQCASSPAIIDCLLTEPCPKYQNNKPINTSVLFGLLWNHINKLKKPNPCPEVL